MADPVVHITAGVPDSGTGNITTLGQTLVDGANALHGAKADAKSSATDTTAVTWTQVFKQISFSMQAAATSLASLVTAIGSTAWDLGSGTGGTRTQRVVMDTSQLSALATTAQAMAAGFQSVDPPTDGTYATRTGSLTETAPASDTASSGLNGRLQRIAQRITSLIALLPATLGQTTKAASLSVAVASDQGGLMNKAFVATFTTLTRPANQTPYSAGDSISDNATAGSVTALSATVSDTNDDPIFIADILISSTDTGLAGKRIRAYLFNSDPTASTGVGGGDNAAYSQKKAGYIGSFSGVLETGFSDGTVGRLVPSFNDSATAPTPNASAGGFVAVKPTSGAKTLYIQYQTLDVFTSSANSTTIIASARGWQARAA